MRAAILRDLGIEILFPSAPSLESPSLSSSGSSSPTSSSPPPKTLLLMPVVRMATTTTSSWTRKASTTTTSSSKALKSITPFLKDGVTVLDLLKKFKLKY